MATIAATPSSSFTQLPLRMLRKARAALVAEIERDMLEEVRRDAEKIRRECQTLLGFIKWAWKILEPTAVFVPGWHIEAICQHLEAVTDGRINRLLINVPPGPMRADSVVETIRGPVPLSEVKVGDRVLTHMGRYRAVEEVHQQGVLPILRITTNSGRVTHAAPTHPYLTPRGWVKAGELQVGDILAVVRPDQDREKADIDPRIARLLGYMVGDGSLTHGPSFTNADEDTIADFEECCRFAGIPTMKRWRKTHWHVGLNGGAPTRAFFEGFGLLGKSSYEKRIPAQIMAADRETVRNFIGAYWSCDGQIEVRASRKRGSIYRASCCTVNERLAEDILYALGMLGIEGRIRPHAVKLETAAQPGGVYRSFNIEIQNEAMTGRFADMPGLCARKNALARLCRVSFERTLWDDEIVSIEVDEPADCLCLSVEDDHSFVCSGIAVHNCSKSLIVSVFWQAWEWGPKGLRSKRYLTTSFNDKAVKRDTRKCRNLMLSEAFQALWPEVVFSRTGETSFENTDTGTREGVAIGSITGQRGDRFIIDDPHSIKKAESETERNNTTRDFIEGGQNRLNDQAKSAIVIIMQRLHMDDLSGVVLARELGYVHLMIPMKFEPARACKTVIGWADPRSVDGELMDPVRFPAEELEKLTKDNEYMEAGQYQQRPAPREGGLFRVDKIKLIAADPGGGQIVRGWDLAGSEHMNAAYTVGLLLRRVEGRFIICDVRRDRWRPSAVREQIKSACLDDGPYCKQSIPQDPGQAGLAQKRDFADYLAGHNLHFSTETGDKVTRAIPVSASVEAGIVDMVQAPWNSVLIEELRNFPTATFKDQVDAFSRAYSQLVTRQGDGPGGMPILGSTDLATGQEFDEMDTIWGRPTNPELIGEEY